MEKRAIYAILLTFVIIMVWSFVQSKFFPPPTPPQPQEARKEQVLPPEKVPGKTEIRESRSLAGVRLLPRQRLLLPGRSLWRRRITGQSSPLRMRD